MRLNPSFVCAWLLAASVGCIGAIHEYSDEASDDPAGDGDPSNETGTSTGDGDGDPSTGDGDGDPSTGDGDGDPSTGDGDGDGDCKLGSPDCACDAGKCEPGYECVAGVCSVSDYPWGGCGWNDADGYYACGYMGESPDPNFPIDCGNLPLVPGSPCPNGLTFEGCCAVGGDAWWCESGKVIRDVCGPG